MEQALSEACCGRCRHANHGTLDAAEGWLACPWLGGTSADSSCAVRFRATGSLAFEPYDGTNGTWGNGSAVFRAPPRGFEGRAVELLREAPGADLDLDLED